MKIVTIVLFAFLTFTVYGQNELILSNESTYKIGAVFILKSEYCSYTYPVGNKFCNDSIINLIANFLKKNTSIVIELKAHTDARGSQKNNLDLSKNVSNGLKKSLVEKGGNNNQIIEKFVGDTEPIKAKVNIVANGKTIEISNTLDKGFISSFKTKEDQERLHELNRRIEIKIVEIKK